MADPQAAAVDDDWRALRAISRSIASAEPADPERMTQWLATLLQEAAAAALVLGHEELPRVILALAHAVEVDDLSLLRAKGTMISVARAEIPRALHGATRIEVVRMIARSFKPEPRTVQGIEKGVPRLVRLLERHRADIVLGDPDNDHVERITRECIKVRNRADAPNRFPVDYARAFLRGWGPVARQKAKDWAKHAIDV